MRLLLSIVLEVVVEKNYGKQRHLSLTQQNESSVTIFSFNVVIENNGL